MTALWLRSYIRLINVRRSILQRRLCKLACTSISHALTDDIKQIFDTERMEWLKPKVYGAIPSARRAHSAVLWKDQIGQLISPPRLFVDLKLPC